MMIEKVRYRLNWAKFRKGYSFFVPCIDTVEAKHEVLRATERLGIDVVMRVEVVDGIKGLRVWRV